MRIPFTDEEREVIELLKVMGDTAKVLSGKRLVTESLQGKCSSDVVYEAMADLYGDTPLPEVSLAAHTQLRIRIAKTEAENSPEGRN